MENGKMEKCVQLLQNAFVKKHELNMLRNFTEDKLHVISILMAVTKYEYNQVKRTQTV